MSSQTALIRDRPWLARFCLILATFTPVLLLASVAIMFFPERHLEGMSAPEEMIEEAPTVLLALISDLINISVGLMVVGWFIYRRKVVKRAENNHTMIFLLIVIFGIASVFSGLRGDYALAFIISTQSFEFDKISGYIETQAGALLPQLMMTSLLAIHFLIFRDHRTTLNA